LILRSANRQGIGLAAILPLWGDQPSRILFFFFHGLVQDLSDDIDRFVSANNSLLPFCNPLAASSSDHVLDNWLAFTYLLPSKLLPHIFSFFMATYVIANTVKSESMYTTLLPIYLRWNLCNFSIKVI